jgi:hypothetical protein
MSNSRYYIVGNNDVWMIQFKDTENGQYKSSNEGIRDRCCAKARDAGRMRTRMRAR